MIKEITLGILFGLILSVIATVLGNTVIRMLF